MSDRPRSLGDFSAIRLRIGALASVDWGRVLRGAEGIASWAATDAIGQDATITVTSAVTSGHVTEIQFDWRSNRFNGQSHAFVTVAGDKVSEFRIPSPQ